MVAVMAAYNNNFIRVRLYFDYPPPAVIDCRMCWLLVDLSICRVVADLESIIREKFEFSRRCVLNLFMEDCYLPHTESIYVVRDNDSVRVKVNCLAPVNGKNSSPDTASKKNSRKRQRNSKEDGPEENLVSMEWKKKKRVKVNKESPENDAKQPSGDERNDKSQEKHTTKKKRKKAVKNRPFVASKPAPKNTPVRVDQPVGSNRKLLMAQAITQNASTSGSSSNRSEEDESPKKTAAQKSAPKRSSSIPDVSKTPPITKPTQEKPHHPSSSSSKTVSPSDEDTDVKTPPKNKPLTSTSPKERINDESKSQHAPSALQSINCAQKQAVSTVVPSHDCIPKPCNSSSKEEIELVIRRPMKQWGRVGHQLSWRSCGRGKNRLCCPGGRGKGEHTSSTRGHNGSFEFSYNGVKEPSYQTDSLINMPVVFQNRAESASKQDYSSMPLLAAPPPVGQKIAFKLLQLTENYTPEISEYKEGRIVSFDHTTNQIELELHNASQAPVEPGKFDLVYQNPDGSERVEYAVSRGSRVTERWDSLREPRLII